MAGHCPIKGHSAEHLNNVYDSGVSMKVGTQLVIAPSDH